MEHTYNFKPPKPDMNACQTPSQRTAGRLSQSRLQAKRKDPQHA